MEGSFEDQYSFCRSCLVVDGQSLDDVNNCLCVQCALKTLESGCHKQHCSAGQNARKELILIDRLIQSFKGDSNSKYEFDSDVQLWKVNYFVDPSSKVYRNLLPQEKKLLVDATVEELKNKRDTGIRVRAPAEELEAFGIWKKKKTAPLPPATSPPKVAPTLPPDVFPFPKPVPVPGDDGDGEYDEDGEETKPPKPKPKPKPPLMYTKTKVFTTYTPNKKTLTKWNPNIISKTIVIDECSDKRTTTTVLATETDTSYETIYKPIFKVTTTTDYDTVWWGTTMTKFKHDLKTKTETDYEVSTKTKYKNDVSTKTETEVEETTKYVKVGKVTVTDIATETEWDVKWRTKTNTKTLGGTRTTTNLTTKTHTQLSTITNHDRTRTKVKTKTMTRTKKIWNPRHTTTVSATAKAFGLDSEDEAANEYDFEREGFGMLNVLDDPAPLLASRRIIKVHNGNGSNFTITTIGGSNSSNYNVEGSKVTGTTNGTNATSGAIIGISAAPQATTAMVVYTTLAVSVATSMMLAFSYHTNLTPADETEDSVGNSSSDGENNDWLDADVVELTGDETRSLTGQVLKGGLLPDEMARKLSENSSINLSVD